MGQTNFLVERLEEIVSRRDHFDDPGPDTMLLIVGAMMKLELCYAYWLGVKSPRMVKVTKSDLNSQIRAIRRAVRMKPELWDEIPFDVRERLNDRYVGIV